MLITLASCDTSLYTTKIYDDAYYAKSKEEVIPTKTVTVSDNDSYSETPKGEYNADDGYYHNDDGTVTYYSDNNYYSESDNSYGGSDSYYDGNGNYIENNYYYIGDDYY